MVFRQLGVQFKMNVWQPEKGHYKSFSFTVGELYDRPEVLAQKDTIVVEELMIPKLKIIMFTVCWKCLCCSTMLFGLELLFSCEKNDILDTVKDIGVAYPVSFRLLEKIFRVCNDRKEENNMNGEEVKSTSKEYVLQSWSKQKGLNPIPIAKAEGIYLNDLDRKPHTAMSAQLNNSKL